MKEIAIFGGTFDPPTLAHEGIVSACLDRSDIEEVWLMPSSCRTDKPGMSSNAARMAMLQLVRAEVFQDNERLVVTDFEQSLPPPTQTYRTVQALEQTYPNQRFWFVYGADAYQAMPEWENGAELCRRLGVLLVSRKGYERPEEGGNIRHLEVDLADHGISSSQFREAHEAEEPADHLVNPAVMAYIRGHALYAAETATGNI